MLSDNERGAALSVGAHVCLATEFIIIHHLGARIPALQVGFLHQIGSLGLIGGIALVNGGFVVRSANLKIQLVRGVLGTARFWAAVFVFGHLPLVDATALSYTQPGFLILFAFILLHESTGIVRWLGVAAGFVGALIVVRPAFADANPGYLLALAAPAISALATVSTKFAYRLDSVPTTFFWISVISLVLTSPALLLGWGWAEPDTVIAVLAVMVLGPVGTYLILLSVRFAEVSALAPYEYSRVVINILAALLVFREMPSAMSWIGATIILLGCGLQSIRQRFA